jgi:hypothetical protein
MSSVIKIKNKKLKKLLKKGGRKGAKEDFFELLKRATRFKKIIKQ